MPIQEGICVGCTSFPCEFISEYLDQSKELPVWCKHKTVSADIKEKTGTSPNKPQHKIKTIVRASKLAETMARNHIGDHNDT